jgi:hypothetical protein
MRRVLVFALVLALGHTSAAVAGETLLASASRLAREAARAQSSSSPATAVAASRGALALAQQGPPVLATSGMSKRMKALIWLAAGVGFAATAYTIDHKVQDNTPSSLGTRKD